MTWLAAYVAPALIGAGAACALLAAAPAVAQPLGSPGDRVEVTWAGKATVGKIESCSSTACDLYLYDDVSGRWSDGTAFFPRSEIRGLRPAPAASADRASGALTEHIAAGLQSQGKLDQAAAMFQRAADTYHGEGDRDGEARALRESAAAYEHEADRLAAAEAPAPPPSRPIEAPALPHAAQASGAIPSGHYGCLYGEAGGSPGYVDIRGGSYRGPTLTASGGFAPYAIGAANSITWSAGFGAFNVISSEYMGISDDTSRRPWFAVLYRRPGGGADRLDCERE